MARIRTIKPEFFTSDDTATMSKGARLLYIGTWCEADREGRFKWNTKNLKRRYLPDDDDDIDVLADELLAKKHIVLYKYKNETYAFIPKFAEHQVINNRESESKIIGPYADGCVIIAGELDDELDETEPTPKFINTPELKPYNHATDKVGNQYTDILVAVNPDLLSQEQKDERFNKLMTELQSSEKWQIEVSTATGKRLQDIQQLLKQFGKNIKADEQYFKPLKEVKTHFRNWAKKNDVPQQPIGFNPYNNIPLI